MEVTCNFLYLFHEEKKKKKKDIPVSFRDGL